MRGEYRKSSMEPVTAIRLLLAEKQTHAARLEIEIGVLESARKTLADISETGTEMEPNEPKQTAANAARKPENP